MRRWRLSVATAAEIEQYSAVIDNLSTAAFAKVKALLNALDDPNPITFRDALLATYPELMSPYFAAASEVAAQWYTELRTQAKVPGVFVPVPAPQPPQKQLEAVVRKSLTPLFRPQEFIGANILELLAGSTQRLITNQGRDTIDVSARQDAATVSWRRVARPGACDFCKMLAGRGSVYRSQAAAGLVIGRGVDPSKAFNEDGSRKVGGIGGGVKARGSQEIASHYHDHCRCVVVPTFYRISDSTADFGSGPERFLVPISA